MRIAFFKTKYGTIWDKIVGNFVKATTGSKWGKYSHVELVFSDGISFSTTPWSGVAFRQIKFNMKEWDFLPLNLPRNKELIIKNWCKTQLRKPYNWYAILLGHIPHKLLGVTLDPWHCCDEKNKWCCTELINYVLHKFNVFHFKDVKLDPYATYRTIKKAITGSNTNRHYTTDNYHYKDTSQQGNNIFDEYLSLQHHS